MSTSASIGAKIKSKKGACRVGDGAGIFGGVNNEHRQGVNNDITLSMKPFVPIVFSSCNRSLITRFHSTTTSTMMFSRNTMFAAVAVVYGASSGSAFAPSSCEWID